MIEACCSVSNKGYGERSKWKRTKGEYGNPTCQLSHICFFDYPMLFSFGGGEVNPVQHHVLPSKASMYECELVGEACKGMFGHLYDGHAGASKGT